MREDVIRTEDVPRCPLCGTEEREVLYTGLRDALFGAPGEWTLKECGCCGLVFLDPRPTAAEIGKAYAIYYTHPATNSPKKRSLARRAYREVRRAINTAVGDSYLSRQWGYGNYLKRWPLALDLLLYLHPGRRAEVDFSIMYLNATLGGRLMDVGCGGGGFMERMRDLGWKAQGVDFDEQAVRAARARGLEAHVGTLESREYPDASFDAVTVSHVIEHVYDPLGLVRECRRVLKPGGSLVVVTPNAGSLGHRYFKEAWRGLEPPRHLQILTPMLLRRIAEEAGFRKLGVSTTIRGATEMFMGSRSIRRTGRHTMGGAQPRPVRLWAWVMQLAELVSLTSKSGVGEEIALIAEK